MEAIIKYLYELGRFVVGNPTHYDEMTQQEIENFEALFPRHKHY